MNEMENALEKLYLRKGQITTQLEVGQNVLRSVNEQISSLLGKLEQERQKAVRQEPINEKVKKSN